MIEIIHRNVNGTVTVETISPTARASCTIDEGIYRNDEPLHQYREVVCRAYGMRTLSMTFAEFLDMDPYAAKLYGKYDYERRIRIREYACGMIETSLIPVRPVPEPVDPEEQIEAHLYRPSKKDDWFDGRMCRKRNGGRKPMKRRTRISIRTAA